MVLSSIQTEEEKILFSLIKDITSTKLARTLDNYVHFTNGLYENYTENMELDPIHIDYE